MLNKIIRYFLENKLITILLLLGFIIWGISTSPFGWKVGGLPSDPVPVDAIPDIGENQQIVFTRWEGRSPQDIEDQISYPLTTYLLGIPGVKSIRSTSIFGFSSIYVIFNEDVEFYWSRSRILEKLSSLPSDLLPEQAKPSLGPDATALGQVYWYTIEGRDPEGNPTGGWDLHEIRSVQDYYVKYALTAADGVSEVASIGGFIQEYQVDVDPAALKSYGLSLLQVMKAVQESNLDVGAKTIELNQAEYLVRGIGYVKSLKDLEESVIKSSRNIPVRIKDVARVSLGPANRRGILDKGGAEVVGGVAVARYGDNPLEVIQNVKDRIGEISDGLPSRTLDDGTQSKLTIVPFYDRSQLIYETLGTLEDALSLEVLISILVVLVMVFNLRASILISSLLPIAILMVFIAMKYFGVTANIVALSGIAIAIGTMVDLGIILSENIIKHVDGKTEGQSMLTTVYNASAEVGSAILTAVSTTIISFIPVFTLQAAEGKLFRPLAFTKTFALVASLLVALLILPALAHWIFGFKVRRKWVAVVLNSGLLVTGLLVLLLTSQKVAGLLIAAMGISWFLQHRFSNQKWPRYLPVGIALAGVTWILSAYWLPLGPQQTVIINFVFVAGLIAIILAFFLLLYRFYRPILLWCLENKRKFIALPLLLMLLGLNIWLGFGTVFGWLEASTGKMGWEIDKTNFWKGAIRTFPGMGEEFMPTLDEGSFLLMPTSMPHSGVEYNREVLGQMDMMVNGIPEVSGVVGKAGRVESALDPAPVSMYENIINYYPEYQLNQEGRRERFRYADGLFILRNGDSLTNLEILKQDISRKQLVPDASGQYFRNWRPHIQSPDDIWDEIVEVTRIPGVTSAPKLQPIETRLVMLQTGMRAPMGIKVFGPDLYAIEEFGLKLEEILKTVPSVKKEAVFAERIVGKPYLHLELDRKQMARHGLTVGEVQKNIEVALGGMKLTTTVEGRERYAIRVRYPRELRNHPNAIGEILITASGGYQIPLEQVVNLKYVRGPQAIKSENTFLVGYVVFDKQSQYAEVEVVEAARAAIEQEINDGNLKVPSGVSYEFSGSYENQVRAEKRLSIIVPVVLVLIFLILYFQFRSVSTSLMVFLGIAMAFSGGFILLWLYGRPDFADFSLFSKNMRDLFQLGPVNLSVAVWVGFIALFGIATDDGVLMATYLDQSFRRNQPDKLNEIRDAVVEAGQKRIRPAIMTSATTIIALLPILTSTGKGSDIMVPMAIPAFGGMLFAAITYFIIPVLYYWREESKSDTNEN